MYSNGILHWRLAERLTRGYCHWNEIGKIDIETYTTCLASLNNSILLSSIAFFSSQIKMIGFAPTLTTNSYFLSKQMDYGFIPSSFGGLSYDIKSPNVLGFRSERVTHTP